MEKENKMLYMQVRLTEKEKSNLTAYCKKYNITISKLLKSLIFNHKSEIELHGRQHNRPPSQVFKWEE